MPPGCSERPLRDRCRTRGERLGVAGSAGPVNAASGHDEMARVRVRRPATLQRQAGRGRVCGARRAARTALASRAGRTQRTYRMRWAALPAQIRNASLVSVDDGTAIARGTARHSAVGFAERSLTQRPRNGARIKARDKRQKLFRHPPGAGLRVTIGRRDRGRTGRRRGSDGESATVGPAGHVTRRVASRRPAQGGRRARTLLPHRVFGAEPRPVRGWVTNAIMRLSDTHL
jgi:hypothetical protein